MPNDAQLLRELAAKVMELASAPVHNERRRLWKAFHRRKPERPMLYVETEMPGWECFGGDLRCEDPFFRRHEFTLRNKLFHGHLGDDFVVEPWITQTASYVVPKEGHWGIKPEYQRPPDPGGAWHTLSPIKTLDDAKRMIVPSHVIDEESTERDVARLREALRETIEVNVSRKPFMSVWGSHISGDIGELRGIETVMMDMIDHPEWLHELCAFMRDGILKVHREAEARGDWSLGDHINQAVPYADELPDPRPNSGPAPMKQLWGLMAAQEMTLISPRMHDEFMLQYQIPVCEMFGLVHYGCCEDLSAKIGILRQIPNLRRIAVTPWADTRKSAEAIGGDYCASWRPSPSDMVCCGYNADRVRRTIRNGLEVFNRNACPVEINLKDVKTVQNEPERLRRFVEICREEIGG